MAIRTVRVCTLVLRFGVGCALSLSLLLLIKEGWYRDPVIKRIYMEEKQLLGLRQSRDTITFPGIDFIQQSTVHE